LNVSERSRSFTKSAFSTYSVCVIGDVTTVGVPPSVPYSAMSCSETFGPLRRAQIGAFVVTAQRLYSL
jgi:hypothetical protein